MKVLSKMLFADNGNYVSIEYINQHLADGWLVGEIVPSAPGLFLVLLHKDDSQDDKDVQSEEAEDTVFKGDN